MSELIPKSKIQQKIDKLKFGGSIPKYQNSGILKKIYYWRSPDYSKTKDGKPQSFKDAYKTARQNDNEDFWWTDDQGNKNIYSSDFQLILPQRDSKDYKQVRYAYLKALENPNDSGYNPDIDRWTPPTSKFEDPNQIGIGLDIKSNNYVRDFLKKTGRTKNPWLTQDEMTKLQDQSLQYFEDVLDRNVKGVQLSNTKRAILLGLLYHGYGPHIWKKKGAKAQKVYDALYKGDDQELINAVNNFYEGNSRAQRHTQFWKLYEK